MSVEEENIIENPEKSTAGLASSTQIIDTTDSAAAIISHTSSELFENHYISLPDHEPARKEKEPKTKQEIFRDSLRKAMRMNANVMKDLARY